MVKVSASRKTTDITITAYSGDLYDMILQASYRLEEKLADPSNYSLDWHRKADEEKLNSFKEIRRAVDKALGNS